MAEWWAGADANRRRTFLYEGRELARLVLEGQWCRRRVINLHFLEERRGEWHGSVDFEVPRRAGAIKLCAAGRGLVWIPVAMYRKHVLPITHMEVRDEQDHIVPTASSAVSTQLAFAMLMGTAARTSLDVARAAPLLWRIAAPNSVASDRALAEFMEEHWPSAAAGGSEVDRQRFLLTLRSLVGSALVVSELPADELGRQHILNLRSDGPVRVSRRFWEMAGWRPLTVAPRVVFGGNARSYHMEIAPPQQILVADSRLIFSYFRDSKEPHTGRELTRPHVREPLGPGKRLWRWWAGGSLRRRRRQEDEEPLTQAIRRQCMERYWDQIEGSAEPMTAHVRARGERFPGAFEGRDVYGIFQFYPAYVGLLTQFLLVGFVNVAFLGAVAWGLDSSRLTRLMALHPDVLLIAAFAVVGIGGGITIVPREHVLTTFVLRPWRQYLLVILFLTLLGPALVLLYGRNWTWTGTAWSIPNWLDDFLLGAVSLAGLTWLVLLAITANVRKAETRGTRRWQRVGLRFRLSRYRHGTAPDEWGPGDRSEEQQEKQLDMIEALYVDQYLRDGSQRTLLDRGVPVSVRHEPAGRGF
ncbi:MAG: hypothetical protein ABSF84_01655 [Acidimicrobiales bacterium]